MTLRAEDAGLGQYGRPAVKVKITYGPVTAEVTEDVSDARSFHEYLGKLLDDIEANQDPEGGA